MRSGRAGTGRLLPAIVALALVAACSGGRAATIETEALPPPFTYVAVGASETLGVGADDPITQSWPNVFHRTALARSATLVNVGESGATVRQTLDRRLSAALAEEPRLVTVWLNVNDLVRQLSVEQYERDLRELVRALRRGGATDVLVAGMPPVLELPVVRACLPGGTGCRLPGRLPSSEVITERVADYQAAIARVASGEGAILVDLAVAAAGESKGSIVAADGFHPSTEGHRRVAAAFADAVAGLPEAASLLAASPPEPG